MSKSSINALWTAYQADHLSNLDALLVALRIKAARVLRDEDAVQVFLLALWGKLDSLTGIRDLDAWTSIRLRWHLLSSARARRHHDVLLEDITTPDMPDLESITDPVVRRAAGCILQGYSQRQCANLLGLSPAALRKRLERYRHSTTNRVPLSHNPSR